MKYCFDFGLALLEKYEFYFCLILVKFTKRDRIIFNLAIDYLNCQELN